MVPTSLFGDCVVGTLLVSEVKETQKSCLWTKKEGHLMFGCFVTTPFPFPNTIVSSSFSDHPFFSRLLHLWCLEMVFGMNFTCSVSVASSCFSFCGWLFECLDSVKSQWNGFSSLSSFVCYTWMSDTYSMICYRVIMLNEYCLINVIGCHRLFHKCNTKYW